MKGLCVTFKPIVENLVVLFHVNVAAFVIVMLVVYVICDEWQTSCHCLCFKLGSVNELVWLFLHYNDDFSGYVPDEICALMDVNVGISEEF
mmetsp:Transcript_20287/g.30250  ORF Transcript_20287/g.30250 Transcript_20287/m.30250 type:complete len:91 (-) Transcript_20287:1-273(-)